VLEIGGGIGAIQAELLEAGAERGEVVEIVGAYEPYARELAAEQGIESRTSFRVHDVLDDPSGVEASEVVVLNRVVCCSPDGVRLTGVAASLCTRTLALSFPRDRRLVRIALHGMNAVMATMRRSFRVFAHPRAELLAAGESQGLALAASGSSFAWEFVVLSRPA
jgi:magnesium-protoporphyrin O-methyltransferase